MELYTMDRNFVRQSILDEYLSVIWTERYYGDGEIELVVPATQKMIKKIPNGTFVGLEDSDRIMIIETINLEDGNFKAKGISLLPWLNNRFIRTTANHADKYWYLSDGPAGWTLWAILYYMTSPDSPYLNGTIDIGIPNPQRFALPNIRLLDCDMSGGNISVGIPYGPIFDAMKDIANTYQVGMQVILERNPDNSFSLAFRSYKGLDRTSHQNVNPVVRFSPQMDSLTGIKELQSIAALKTHVYSFAPGLNPNEGEPDIRTVAGESVLTDATYTGFDLRAMLVLADDITTDQVGGDPTNLVNVLNSRAFDALVQNHAIKAVDGEIVPENRFKYGVHYNLGDLVEVQGNSGVISIARVTEYIRSQDATGEKAYPTIATIG